MPRPPVPKDKKKKIRKPPPKPKVVPPRPKADLSPDDLKIIDDILRRVVNYDMRALEGAWTVLTDRQVIIGPGEKRDTYEIHGTDQEFWRLQYQHRKTSRRERYHLRFQHFPEPAHPDTFIISSDEELANKLDSVPDYLPPNLRGAQFQKLKDYVTELKKRKYKYKEDPLAFLRRE